MTDDQGYGWQPQQVYDQQYGQDQPWHVGWYDPDSHRLGISRPQPPHPQAQGAPPPLYPQQGAPWMQPGYGPQPHPAQPQSFPGQQRSPRRKRHAARNVLVGLGSLVVVIVAIGIAVDHGGHSVQVAASAANAGTPGGTSQDGGAPKTAGIGSAITLSRSGSGEQLAVTVTKVINSARPGGESGGAPAGDRLYAVQFRLRDTGGAPYLDAPASSAVVVDSAGQSYRAAITDSAAGCQGFPATENIAPGSSGLGCVVFQVPEAAKIADVQFTLDSGLASQTGQWNVG
jgi:hypothetical protein